MRLSLGPLLYQWSRDAIEAFYAERMADPVDVVYLGETVCAKRRSLATDDWLANPGNRVLVPWPPAAAQVAS